MEDVILIESIHVVVQVHPRDVKCCQHRHTEHDSVPANGAIFHNSTALDHHPKIDYVNKDEHPISYPLLLFPFLRVRLMHYIVLGLLIPDNCCRASSKAAVYSKHHYDLENQADKVKVSASDDSRLMFGILDK